MRLLALLLLVSPAMADVTEAVQGRILPDMASLAASAATLREAGKTCDMKDLQDGFQANYDAWMAVQHLHLAPSEEEGRGLAVLYWPDPKGLGWKAQKRLLAGPIDAASFARQSVAARGLSALERLIYPAEPLADPCPLIAATTADLARVTGEIAAAWGPEAEALTHPGNPEYQTETEARQALFTQLATGLENLTDTRLGRPLGTFDAPTPQRAEARASGRSLRNVTLSLRSLRALTEALAPNSPLTLAAFDTAITQAEHLNDPIFDGTATPQGRLKVEILQQSIARIRELALTEVAPELGVGVGFNAADGD